MTFPFPLGFLLYLLVVANAVTHPAAFAEVKCEFASSVSFIKINFMIHSRYMYCSSSNLSLFYLFISNNDHIIVEDKRVEEVGISPCQINCLFCIALATKAIIQYEAPCGGIFSNNRLTHHIL